MERESTSEVVEDILSHHGVLGMKWGRRSASSGSMTRKDKKFEKKAGSASTWAKVHNESTAHFNSGVEKINNKPYVLKAVANGDLRNSNTTAYKKYHKEVSNLYLEGVNKAAAAQGTNPSGTRQMVAVSHEPYTFALTTAEVKHEDLLRVVFEHDEDGVITGVHLDGMAQSTLIVGDILSHHGIKGMKWGVRQTYRNYQAQTVLGKRKAARSASAVTVTEKGKKIKTSGGAGRSAHPDAIRARTAGQIGKRSGVKALSNEELQAYSKRLQLEASVKRLHYNDSSPPKKFVLTLLGQTGKNQAHELASDVASHQVKKHLTRRLVTIGAVAAA